MARPKFSGIGIVDMQNSLGATTFSRNAYGTYSKAKKGAPASTSYLLSWQAVVAALRFDWANIMTDTDRETWYKLYIPRRNNMAEIKQINGFRSYLSVNMNLGLLSLPAIYTAPGSYDAPRCDFISVAANSITNKIVATRATAPVYPMAIYITPMLPPGRMSLNQIYFFIGVLNAGDTFHDFAVPYNLRFGAITLGSKVFIRACTINPNNGMRSNFTYSRTTVIP